MRRGKERNRSIAMCTTDHRKRRKKDKRQVFQRAILRIDDDFRDSKGTRFDVRRRKMAENCTL